MNLAKTEKEKPYCCTGTRIRIGLDFTNLLAFIVACKPQTSSVIESQSHLLVIAARSPKPVQVILELFQPTDKLLLTQTFEANQHLAQVGLGTPANYRFAMMSKRTFAVKLICNHSTSTTSETRPRVTGSAHCGATCALDLPIRLPGVLSLRLLCPRVQRTATF